MPELARITTISPSHIGQTLTVAGWVKAFRNDQFIALNDGSCAHNLQVVVDPQLSLEVKERIKFGAAIRASGRLVESLGQGQAFELKAETLEVLGECPPETFPLQPKRQTLEFLREHAHLRFRTNTFGAVFRLRHHLAFAIQRYFHERGFVWLHSPILTASDAEGAGEMFRVTTLNLSAPPRLPSGEVDGSQDFFGRAAHLTVSGQLEAELAATALGKVYTFGPTFRAENSNTTRHLAEFWMIEPEVAFANLEDNMALAEDFLKSVIGEVLQTCDADLALLETRLIEEEKSKPADQRSPKPLREKLRFVVETPFARMTYSDAIEALLASPAHKKGKFAFPITGWGMDLQSEHERYLVEKLLQKPLILTDYPAQIKAFYMRLNNDEKTVAAMDILFPGIGEIVGGSQREERYDVLVQKMQTMGIPTQELSWYLDTRRFGSCPHAGFGLGFERLMVFVSGLSNIRDVIPFPRYPGGIAF